MISSTRVQTILVLAVIWLYPALTMAQVTDPTVGAAGRIKQIILPGPELVAKPIVSSSPMVVRIVDVFPHGDRFRYDIVFHGLEPGHYNLANWLIRKDGSITEDLPEIIVEIKSLLPPGQIEPNALETGWLPRLGGYRNVMIAVISLWAIILLALIFGGRKKTGPHVETVKIMTLADLLETRLQAASENRMSKEQYAELERMLFAFWRDRLALESEDVATALNRIHNDTQAGPLMKQLEQWMHSPTREQDIDLATLLIPYRNLPANTPGFDP